MGSVARGKSLAYKVEKDYEETRIKIFSFLAEIYQAFFSFKPKVKVYV